MHTAVEERSREGSIYAVGPSAQKDKEVVGQDEIGIKLSLTRESGQVNSRETECVIHTPCVLSRMLSPVRERGAGSLQIRNRSG